uniref:Uncharacterized protein n=1 Tax=Rhizophora mucronata TaxID=61149 RepID=A0A2P2Q6V1_RHIMU
MVIRLGIVSRAPEACFQNHESKDMIAQASALVQVLEEAVHCHRLPFLVMDCPIRIFLALAIRVDLLLVVTVVPFSGNASIHSAGGLELLRSKPKQRNLK